MVRDGGRDEEGDEGEPGEGQDSSKLHQNKIKKLTQSTECWGPPSFVRCEF